MTELAYFVPGDLAEEKEVLLRLRWPIPSGVTRAYVEACTYPGQTVLVPYCQGPAVVQEILAAERRALAINFDPLLALLVKSVLNPLPTRQLDAAVARLGDSPKHGVPLRQYLEDLYATTCPACLRPAVADYFIWDREQEAPVAKYLRCPQCNWDGQALVDPEDLARLDDVPVRGMHYYYLLDRIAPHPEGDAHRSRLESLLELYSPRNLYALAELTLKIESLFPEEKLREGLVFVLLDCLDRCSSLAPLPRRRTSRSGLKRPRRFPEQNVWRAFEEAASSPQAVPGKPAFRLAPSLEAFQTSAAEWAGFVGQTLVRDLPRTVRPRSIWLILTSPPPLDATAWVLSYFWGAWLLGSEAVSPLLPLLRQRTPDPAWYGRVMAGSLKNLASLLRDDGLLVLILTEQRPAVVEALLLAASRVRLGVAFLVQCGAHYRLALTPTLPQPAVGEPRGPTAPGLPKTAQIQQATTQVAADTIRARGEPVAWRTLHAAIYWRLAEMSLLSEALEADGPGPSPLDTVAEQVQAGLEDPALIRLPPGEGGEELWWLSRAADLAPPLCDRIEQAAHQILQENLALTEDAFARAVYVRFPGILTPAASLVTICLRDYGCEMTPGYWHLRPEDLPAARQTEKQAIIQDLLALGKRLGYEAMVWDPFDVAWFEGRQARAAFVVRWYAALGEAVALSSRLQAARPYLVIPGGRAALASYKLAHNPLWRQALERAGWLFIKYRHVRQLVAQEDVDEYALQTIVGLDPIVEKESAQLSLF